MGGEGKTLRKRVSRSLSEGREALEQRIEREWKSILCPGDKERTRVMVEWEILSKKGRIFKRTLKQIDCCHSKLTVLGGTDCDWKCKGVIIKREK